MIPLTAVQTAILMMLEGPAGNIVDAVCEKLRYAYRGDREWRYVHAPGPYALDVINSNEAQNVGQIQFHGIQGFPSPFTKDRSWCKSWDCLLTVQEWVFASRRRLLQGRPSGWRSPSSFWRERSSSSAISFSSGRIV